MNISGIKKIVRQTVTVVSLTVAVSSCRAPKDVTYFSNLGEYNQSELVAGGELKVLPGDRVSVVVSSKDPQLSALFNLPIVSQRLSQPGVTSAPVARNSSNEVASYVVDAQGCINFPVLGSINLQGKTRDEVATYIQAELVSHDLVKDPVVIVDFLNRGVSVLGEVAKPGRITFDRDRITILDALAEAGDLNITGKRTDVLVMRRVGNQELTYRVDLTNSESVLNSPAYYLQQDDVVYVSPTDVRKRQTTANGNSPLTPSFWISILSLLATVAVLVFN